MMDGDYFIMDRDDELEQLSIQQGVSWPSKLVTYGAAQREFQIKIINVIATWWMDSIARNKSQAVSSSTLAVGLPNSAPMKSVSVEVLVSEHEPFCVPSASPHPRRYFYVVLLDCR